MQWLTRHSPRRFHRVSDTLAKKSREGKLKDGPVYFSPFNHTAMQATQAYKDEKNILKEAIKNALRKWVDKQVTSMNAIRM